MRRVPVIPTIVVLAAAATMVALGFWQLQRSAEKATLIARAERSLQSPAEVAYPSAQLGIETAMYRRTRVICSRVIESRSSAGTSALGEKGWAHGAVCALPDGRRVPIDLGFSREPTFAGWAGGEIAGTIAPGGRIVAANPPAGLTRLARPDPRDLPNNHLAYAGQWFFFALTALGIYGLVLRKRWRERAR
ncbi:SURF1 family protein [Qipengyuania sp. MTN3-11]|uniref:SURF1 family protein n=1 Tax=Qipengyuania sp. MTN3-11 TaxID=3056557 RepID=UPI0036F20F77